MIKFIPLTITVFFLFSFLKTNGQNPIVSINQSAAQPDPANVSPINFTVMFDQPVIGFTTGDVFISGTAGANVAVVTGGPTLFNVSVSGMITCGTVIANIPAGICFNSLLQPNLASTSLDNTVNYGSGFSNSNVIINQAASQPDPTSASPINFIVVFEHPVTGFTTGDVTLSGTAGATTAIVTGIGYTYNVAVSGMTASGTVIATIAAGVAQSSCSPSNNASTSTDNTVTITCIPPVVNVTPAVSCGGVVSGGPCNALTASGNADIYIWTPLAGLYTDCSMTTPYTGTNLATVYAAPIANTIYTVTGTISATGCSSKATAQVNYTPPAPVVTPPSVNMCLGDPAVKLVAGIHPFTAQFCSGNVNIPVPDNNPAGASNNITVSGIPVACTVTAISVTINMPHGKVGDMVFVLKAPNGNILNLDYYLSGSGGNGITNGFVNTIISSLGTAFLSTGSNPYNGTYRADAQVGSGGWGLPGPTGMQPTVVNWTSLHTGGPINGTWTLGFYDGITGYTGTLNSWCINITYSCGNSIPTTPAVWSPIAGLFNDPASTAPYIGDRRDTVWTRPTPAGIYTYQVTTQGVPLSLCTPTTNFISSNGNATVTFNVRNNHPFPIILSHIDSKTFTVGLTSVRAYYKATGISGNPGPISAANGWIQFGSGSITGIASSVQRFLSNLSLVIPAGTAYGICVEAFTGINSPNLSYSALTPGTQHSFNDGECEIITGTNIGFSGANVPAAPTITPSGFIGAVHFSQATTPCTSPPRSVVVTVNQPITITQQPVAQTVCFGASAGFSVNQIGTGPFTYQWQVSSNGGTSYNNIVNGGVFGGALTNTLLVNAPPVTMNGNLFRVVVNGASVCAAATSASALLTVNPLPNIVITASPLIIGPTQTTTIFSTVTPNSAAVYTWFYNNTVLPGAGLPSLLVNYGSPGDYHLRVTDVNGCTNLSNIIAIANSFALNMYTYPNPSGGIFQVRYQSEPNSTLQRSLTVYNNRGERIIAMNFTQTIPYQIIEVDVRANGKGLYWVEVRDANGKRLGMNRVVVQ